MNKEDFKEVLFCIFVCFIVFICEPVEDILSMFRKDKV